jgi:hypothetical protein
MLNQHHHVPPFIAGSDHKVTTFTDVGSPSAGGIKKRRRACFIGSVCLATCDWIGGRLVRRKLNSRLRLGIRGDSASSPDRRYDVPGTCSRPRWWDQDTWLHGTRASIRCSAHTMPSVRRSATNTGSAGGDAKIEQRWQKAERATTTVTDEWQKLPEMKRGSR